MIPLLERSGFAGRKENSSFPKSGRPTRSAFEAFRSSTRPHARRDVASAWTSARRTPSNWLPSASTSASVSSATSARICPQKKVVFSAGYRLAARTRDGLVMREGTSSLSAVEADTRIRKLFGRSLKLRSVSAGGCNGCELEINATANVNFDSGRYGIDIVASPAMRTG